MKYYEWLQAQVYDNDFNKFKLSDSFNYDFVNKIINDIKLNYDYTLIKSKIKSSLIISFKSIFSIYTTFIIEISTLNNILNDITIYKEIKNENTNIIKKVKEIKIIY